MALTEVAQRCDFRTGDIIDNDWTVDDFLGEGTFGQVFRVHDRTGNPRALKILKLWSIMASERPALLKRFDREYETGRIQSDYLVHTIHKGSVRGNAYIVMEFCSGGDLFHAHQKGNIDLAHTASQILLGLRDLHNNGKVHRDLKPENVLLRADGHAVLTDFGISGDQNNRLTRRGLMGVPQEIFGTILYMPPEQHNPPRGNATVLPTTDIFSFGVMMYQLLTGNFPFGQTFETQNDIAQYSINAAMGKWDRSVLSRIPDGTQWTRLIEGCLEPNFKNRLQTADEVLALVPSNKGFTPRITPPQINFNTDPSRGLILRVMQGEELGRVYNLSELFRNNSSIICVGRASADVWNHLPILETESCYISRQHCTIEYNILSNSWIIRDGQFRLSCPLGLRSSSLFPCPSCTAHCTPAQKQHQWKESLNGTFVNSNEVPPSGVSLAPGDIISLGDVKMRVEGA